MVKVCTSIIGNRNAPDSFTVGLAGKVSCIDVNKVIRSDDPQNS